VSARGVRGPVCASRRTTDRRTSYRWTVEIEVSETWVEDGYGTAVLERLEESLMPWAAAGREVVVRVVREPDPMAVFVAQGGKVSK